jgi:hypothetical protein
MRDDWPEVADQGDADVLSEKGNEFRMRVEEEVSEGGVGELLSSLEEQLSNVVRLTERETLRPDDVRAMVDQLEVHCRN